MIARAFLLIAVQCLAGCSTLLRSSSAEFDDGEIKACDFGPPTYVKAPVPGGFALFGGTLAAHRDTLMSSAWFEVNPRTGAPAEGAELMTGLGAIRVYSGVADKPELVRPLIYHEPNSPAILPKDGLPGVLQDAALITTHPIALSDSWLAIGDAGRDTFRGAVRLFERRAYGNDVGQVLTRKDGQEGDFFGLGLAFDRDTLVVGAPGSDRGAESGGMTYVYRRGPSGHELVAEFEPPAPRPSGWFGAAVAISPEWIVVTAPGALSADEATDNAGAYAFRRDGDAIDPTPHLIPRPPGAGYFGASVSLDGDWLAIGAPGTPSAEAEPFAGSAHLYRLESGEWVLMKSVDTMKVGGTLFGWTVALTSESLFAGFAWASPDSSLGAAGRVHVFQRDEDGNILNEPCHLSAPNPDIEDSFGTALAAGQGFVAISAPFEDGRRGGVREPDGENQLADSGAVYVYRTNAAQSVP